MLYKYDMYLEFRILIVFTYITIYLIIFNNYIYDKIYIYISKRMRII